METSTPVLVVGAGPTGLVLAYLLARYGVPVRLIDEAAGPGEHSRAVAVHARTLEFYQQFGFVAEIIDAGIHAQRGRLREGSGSDAKEVLHFEFKDLGEGLSPFPYILFYPQDDHERMLLGKLREHGVDVEWRSRLASFTQDDHSVHATIEGESGSREIVDTPFVCGCDGVHSQVRKTLGLGFAGGTYDQLFYVADVLVEDRDSRDMYFNLGEDTLALMFPVRKDGSQRLLGLAPKAMSERKDLAWEDVREEAEALVGVKVKEVRWFSSYHVHHRISEHFRVGRAFLMGDAGHVHSPAGGQGMNTGIGDAINLGWKLAAVLQGRAALALLDSFEPERIAFARKLVNTTDQAFTGMIAGGTKGELLRRVLAPLVFSVATRLRPAQHELFRTLSQTAVQYDESPLSEGKSGDVHGGDRLPWAQGEPDNFAPLKSLDWQAHVYGEPGPEIRSVCERLRLSLHAFEWTKGSQHAGFKEGAAYLVRPDGYVGLAASGADAGRKLQAYCEQHGLRFAVDRSN